jgi:excisionase family DNA binding protein
MSAVLVMSPDDIREIVRSVMREELANHHQNPGSEVLTAEHVAEMLEVHVRTVAKLVVRDGLPARRLGREYRFSRAEVLAWLEERSMHPGAHVERRGANLRRVRGD